MKTWGSAAAAVVLLATSGCAALSGEDDATDSASGTQVAAAFYPLAYAAERVAGEHAVVTSLTEPGQEPHDLELSVQLTAELTGADLVVHESGFQPAIDDGVEQNATGDVVDAAEAVDLLAVEESEAEHEGHEEHAEEEGEEEHGHDHGPEDPHFWHDPLRMAELGDAVADGLTDVDPDHADDYAANAADLRAELEALDAEFTEGLTGCERDHVVVSHDAFGYLEKYGIHLESIAGLSPDSEPSPAELSELHELIEDEGVTTVFYERLTTRDLSESLASDLRLKTAVLDPIEGLTDETAGEDYVSLMRQNLAALRNANGCP